MIVMLVFFMAMGAVCATDTVSDDIISDDNQEDVIKEDNSEILETTPNDVYSENEDSFTSLEEDIRNAGDNFDISQNYKFNNETDNSRGIVISKNNFVLNGHGFTIDGNNQSRLFNITGNNVTINDLILRGGYSNRAGAICAYGNVTLNNITFINNYVTGEGGAVGLNAESVIICNNSLFIDNYGDSGSSIYVARGQLYLNNTNISSKVYSPHGQIVLNLAKAYIENSNFMNINSTYTPALYAEKCLAISVVNSNFINLTANISAGAMAVKKGGEIFIKNCEFINTTSTKNAGAFIADITGDGEFNGNVTMIDTIFRDTRSEFGGAYIQFGGDLVLNNSEFTNSHATYNGGAVYLSFVNNAEINNCNFTLNSVDIIEGYPTYGGALFCDKSTLKIVSSKFFNNTAFEGNGIYAYDTKYDISNSIFANNTNAIYTVFDVDGSILDSSNIFYGDTNSTNNTFYASIQVGKGLQLNLINNTINVTVIPSRFDLRDWKWVSSVKNQGLMGACWTFGMCGVLESALLKATGLSNDFSENNMQNTMLCYSIYGSTATEGGANVLSTGYLVSWFGAFGQNVDEYDEIGKLSPMFTTNNDIHVQDFMFIPNNEIPNGTQLKLAILQYGSIDVSYFGQSTYDEDNPYYNPETYAQYVNDTSLGPNHAVSIVGWDDNFSKENFLITPPGDGAWIVKNSWGSKWGDQGYCYVSYYDQSLLKSTDVTTYATALIFENTVPYNKNYQYDNFGGSNFSKTNGNVSYYNVFESIDDDLIAAVGTYFNQSGVNYKLEIYVNNKLKLTQEGLSPYFGYHTIKLNDYIPIKKGDVFKAVITSNSMPFLPFSETRMHYTENISFVSFDGNTWEDCYGKDCVACLKVYTVEDNTKIINNKNIVVDYDGGSYFSVKVVTDDGHSVGAGEKVKFTINKKSTTVTTDANGIAKLKIVDLPGKYTITTTYKGTSVKNTVTVKQVLTTSKVNVKRTAKKFYLQAKLKINGKFVKSKVISFKLNGKTYKAKTNSKGIAKVIVKNNLKKGKTYTFTVTYLKDTIKSTVKVSR